MQYFHNLTLIQYVKTRGSASNMWAKGPVSIRFLIMAFVAYINLVSPQIWDSAHTYVTLLQCQNTIWAISCALQINGSPIWPKCSKWSNVMPKCLGGVTLLCTTNSKKWFLCNQHTNNVYLCVTVLSVLLRLILPELSSILCRNVV